MHEMMDTINVVPTPGDPDHHFALMMIMHHEGAINMANVVLREGEDETMAKLARNIVQKQSREIVELKAFLQEHIPGTVNHEFNIKMELCMESMDRVSNPQSVNGNIDHDFATLMIAHHQSAIDMADLIIQYGRDPEVLNLAREIKDDQETEMAEFNLWLAKGN